MLVNRSKILIVFFDTLMLDESFKLHVLYSMNVAQSSIRLDLSRYQFLDVLDAGASEYLA